MSKLHQWGLNLSDYLRIDETLALNMCINFINFNEQHPESENVKSMVSFLVSRKMIGHTVYLIQKDEFDYVSGIVASLVHEYKNIPVELKQKYEKETNLIRSNKTLENLVFEL